MGDVHQEVVAAYTDLGSLYSYGYGAIRSRYEVFNDGLCDLDQLHEGMQSIISAVEFRSAEIQASRLMAEDRILRDCGHQPYQPVQAETNAIYQAPVSADGIARDQ